jgi:hypothetical protein
MGASRQLPLTYARPSRSDVQDTLNSLVLAGPPNERSKVDQVEALIATRIATKRRLRVSSLVPRRRLRRRGPAAGGASRRPRRTIQPPPTHTEPILLAHHCHVSGRHLKGAYASLRDRARSTLDLPAAGWGPSPTRRTGQPLGKPRLASQSANSPQHFADDLKGAGPH